MDSWVVQVLTLLGVAVGASASFFSTRALERIRWQREETIRWDTKRLDSYGDFAATLKQLVGISHRLAAGLGLPSDAEPLDLETGLSALAAAEADLHIKREQILMLGGPSTVASAREWRDAVEHLERLVRDLPEEATEWTRAEQLSVEARKGFYESVRSELRIVTDELPDGSKVLHLPEKTSSSRTSGAAGRLAVVPTTSVCWWSCWLATVRGRCCTFLLYSACGE